MSESTSATREVETSVVSLINIFDENEFLELQDEILTANDNYSKQLKGLMRQILRENLRELKYLENVSAEFLGLNESTEIKKYLKDLKEYLENKDFQNFYLEFHLGKNGEDHIQILADNKEKEKAIKLEVEKYLKKDTEEIKKEEVKNEEKLNDFFNKINKQLENIFSNVNNKLDSINNKLDDINSKYDKFINKFDDKFDKTEQTETETTQNIEDIKEKATKLLQKHQ